MADFLSNKSTLPAATFTSNLVFVVQTDRTDVAKLKPVDGAGVYNLRKIARFFEKCASGAYKSNVFVMTPTSGVGSGIGLSNATGSITIAGPADAKTVVVAGNTFTTETGTIDSELEFFASTDGTSQVVTAVALANKINEYPPTASLVAATNNASNIVTITSRVPGVIGNSIGISCGDEWAVASAATLAGGSNIDVGIILGGL